MKRIIFLLATINLFFVSDLGATEKGKWIFVVDDNYCYIASAPTKEEGDYTQRGDTYVLVYRINTYLHKESIFPYILITSNFSIDLFHFVFVCRFS